MDATKLVSNVESSMSMIRGIIDSNSTTEEQVSVIKFVLDDLMKKFPSTKVESELDFASMPPVDMARYRVHIATKWKKLQDLCPNLKMPDLSQNDSLELIHAKYQAYLKEVL